MTIKLNNRTYWVSNDTRNQPVTRTGYGCCILLLRVVNVAYMRLSQSLPRFIFPWFFSSPIFRSSCGLDLPWQQPCQISIFWVQIRFPVLIVVFFLIVIGRPQFHSSMTHVVELLLVASFVFLWLDHWSSRMRVWCHSLSQYCSFDGLLISVVGCNVGK